MLAKMTREEDVENFLSFLLHCNSDSSSGSGPKVCRAVIKKMDAYDPNTFKDGTYFRFCVGLLNQFHLSVGKLGF